MRTVNLKNVKTAKSILLQVAREYEPDISSKYADALDRTIDLLRDIEDDLAERSTS